MILWLSMICGPCFVLIISWPSFRYWLCSCEYVLVLAACFGYNHWGTCLGLPSRLKWFLSGLKMSPIAVLIITSGDLLWFTLKANTVSYIRVIPTVLPFSIWYPAGTFSFYAVSMGITIFIYISISLAIFN